MRALFCIYGFCVSQASHQAPRPHVCVWPNSLKMCCRCAPRPTVCGRASHLPRRQPARVGYCRTISFRMHNAMHWQRICASHDHWRKRLARRRRSQPSSATILMLSEFSVVRTQISRQRQASRKMRRRIYASQVSDAAHVVPSSHDFHSVRLRAERVSHVDVGSWLAAKLWKWIYGFTVAADVEAALSMSCAVCAELQPVDRGCSRL